MRLEPLHHPRVLVLEHVAMEHPVAWVVGHEPRSRRACAAQQHGIEPFAMARRPSFAREERNT